MTNEQALQVLAQVAVKFIGTRQDHELVEQALKTLAEAVAPKDANDKGNVS
jgi:hypothetical protein